MYKLIKQEGHARRGEFRTPHGTVQAPVFMNVGTQGAIKGALSAADLKNIGCQIELSNTYHLHVRPGDGLIKDMGGLHKFMTWGGPILTDSGGFQIFSLAKLRKITEEGVKFNSHVDGRHIFMGPEESMRIQANLGSDIAMAFDECIKIPSPREYGPAPPATGPHRWLQRCKAALAEYNSMDDAVEPGADAVRNKSGDCVPRHPHRAHEEDRRARTARLRDRRARSGRDASGDVRHHRGGGGVHAEG